MAKYLRKPIVVEAIQWFKNGDHPLDDCHEVVDGVGVHLSEGKIVKKWLEQGTCVVCKEDYKLHGEIEDNIFGGMRVCPGDWIVQDPNGEWYLYPNKEFHENYISMTKLTAAEIYRLYDSA